MPRQTKNTEAMTLRMPQSLDEAVSEACWASRTSKSEWIRRAIRSSLGVGTPLPHRLRKEPLYEEAV